MAGLWRSRSRALPLVVIALLAVVALAIASAALLRVGPWQPTAFTAAGAIPKFVDDTGVSGLEFTYDGPFEYAVGGGLAVFDCNDDHRPDLFLAGGEGRSGLYRNDSKAGEEIVFTRLSDNASDITAANGAYPIDVDGDHRIDLVVLRNAENVVLRGLGECRFDRANERWNLISAARHTQAFSATWESFGHWPTLAFGNYVDATKDDPSTWCESNVLIRPSADGRRFTEPVALNPSYCSLSMLFSSWDGSGRMDLRVSNDQHYYDSNVGEEQLWRMEPKKDPELYTRGDGWVQLQLQGMGIASRDLTGDGLPEIYLTSQAASRLQTLAEGPARPAYRDIGAERNVNVSQPFIGGEHLPSTAWHPEFEDVNNDGFVDLFVSKGNVTTQPDYARLDPSNLLLGQPDGTFREIADVAGTLTFARGRGAALADFNVDGWPDLVESFYGAQTRIWRNTGPEGGADLASTHWMELRIGQLGSNVDAIGAVVEVRFADRVDSQELTIGGGHASGQLGWLHFGLGTARTADVHIRWPNGTTSDYPGLSANAFYLIERGSPPLLWAPTDEGAE